MLFIIERRSLLVPRGTPVYLPAAFSLRRVWDLFMLHGASILMAVAVAICVDIETAGVLSRRRRCHLRPPSPLIRSCHKKEEGAAAS